MAPEATGSFQYLRYMLFGGQAVDTGSVNEVLRDGPPEALLHVYGPTEVTTYSTWHRVTELDDTATTVPIGRPIANTTTYVLDRLGKPVPAGIPGELYLGGDGVARGYLNRPELTDSHFVEDTFSTEPGARLYRTGDWVRYLDDGAIEFIGRQDDQVKLRGFRIELGEIESAISQHPGIREVVIMVREDEPGDKRLVAYLIPQDEEQDLRSFLKQKLPDYMRISG
jgi:non-ribosomal peptide synthetase component F